jgi:hypothetical protein
MFPAAYVCLITKQRHLVVNDEVFIFAFTVSEISA